SGSDRRKSMSALTAAWPFSTRDNITRLIPMCAAKAVTVMPRSCSQPASNSPGEAGSCMSIGSGLVVIDIVEKLHVGTREPECEPPVGLDGQGMKPVAIADEPVKPPGWPREISRMGGDVQGGEQRAKALPVHRLDTRHAARSEEGFQPLVPEREDHRLLTDDLQSLDC